MQYMKKQQKIKKITPNHLKKATFLSAKLHQKDSKLLNKVHLLIINTNHYQARILKM